MARPTVSGYLPYQWTHPDSNRDRQHAMLESFPLDDGPALQWTAGESNSDSRLAKPVSCRLDEQPEPVIPHGLEPWFPACETGVVAAGPRDQKAVPTGVDPVPLPRQGSMQCRYTKAPKSVAEVGVEPTKSPPPQDGRFTRFAYPDLSNCRPRYRAGHADLMRVCRAPARLHRK